MLYAPALRLKPGKNAQVKGSSVKPLALSVQRLKKVISKCSNIVVEAAAK
jgi:hypothetical protein